MWHVSLETGFVQFKMLSLCLLPGRRRQLQDTAMAANPEAQVSNRPVTGEPLYLIFNLGMSQVSTVLAYISRNLA